MLRTDLDALRADVEALRERVRVYETLQRDKADVLALRVGTDMIAADLAPTLGRRVLDRLNADARPLLVRALDLWRAARAELAARGYNVPTKPAPARLDDVVRCVSTYVDALELLPEADVA